VGTGSPVGVSTRDADDPHPLSNNAITSHHIRKNRFISASPYLFASLLHGTFLVSLRSDCQRLYGADQSAEHHFENAPYSEEKTARRHAYTTCRNSLKTGFIIIQQKPGCN